MNRFDLHRSIFPDSKICDIKEMFFRSSAHYDQTNKLLVCNSPSHIDFHSYFNVIPVKHFFDFLGLNHVDILCRFRGRAEFLLYANKLGVSEPILVAQTVIESNSLDVENEVFTYFDISKIDGYVYLVLNTHSDTFEMQDFYVSCLSDREPAKVGIVSCTFRREKEVLRTIDCISSQMTADPFTFKNAEMYVIDNDEKKNLKVEETDFIHHLANKNLGGAGGFTRGIIESIRANKDYVLLCDDDILAFGEVFRRAVAVLSLMQDPKKGLHGCMLEEESKYSLHEVGEYFDINKRMHVNPYYGKNMTNLNDLKMVAFESVGTSRSANMFGWWFTAFPVSIIKEIGLPMPVFVSGDDLEYGLRAVKAGYSSYIVPSISVWHPSHMTQHAPLRNYFITRNRFAYYPVHTSKQQLEKLFEKTLKQTYRHLLSKRYATAESSIVAMEDFLRGPEWFNEDLSNWSKSLKYGADEKAQKLYDNKWLVPTVHKHLTASDDSLKNKVYSKLTFNGHILPKFFHKKAKDPSSQYHVCIPYGVNPQGENITKMTLRSSSILYFDPRFSVGFNVRHNSKKFWILYARLLKVKALGKKKIPSLYEEYRKGFENSIELEWWEKRLGIESKVKIC